MERGEPKRRNPWACEECGASAIRADTVQYYKGRLMCPECYKKATGQK